MKVTKEQLNTLCLIAKAAAREIMSVYGKRAETWRKDDSSPLTEADLNSDRVIRRELEKAFPGFFILSEESASVGCKDENAFFLVDPLDGTKEFLNQNDEFTVNIALVNDGQVIAGVVLAPALGQLFCAARGLGAWVCEGQRIRTLQVSSYQTLTPLRVIGSRSHGREALSAWLARLPEKHTFVAAGSSLKFCRIAEGQADIYPRFGPTSQWDTAAAQCVLEMAGGAVVDFTGRRLRYGLERSVLNPQFVALGSPSLISLLDQQSE